jgi:hypothetical protein
VPIEWHIAAHAEERRSAQSYHLIRPVRFSHTGTALTRIGCHAHL